MKKHWLRFCCFIVGYNYNILKNCSEISVKTVKKNISALFIISIIWGFIGYSFAERYIKLEMIECIIMGLIMVFIIINIERQIILSIGKNEVASLFRIFIGVIMAVIGSIIIDQIVFKEDIEKEKLNTIQMETDKLLISKSKLIDSKIKEYDSIIRVKELNVEKLNKDINKKPTTRTYTYTSEVNINYIDSIRNTVENPRTIKKYEGKNIANPKIETRDYLRTEIEKDKIEKRKKEKEKISLREIIEKELKENTGLLDELEILYSIISKSWISGIFYIIIFLFFLSLELFIVFNKLFDKSNDYDETLLHQMKIKKQQLKDFSRLTESF